MKDFLHLNKGTVAAVVTVTLIVIAAAVFLSGRGPSASTNAQRGNSTASNSPQSDPTVDLTPSQLNSIKIEPVGSYQFPVEKETVGTISFADDLTVDVFPAYQGTILKAFVELGTQVKKDQPLYTIKSPDLIQAESTLIGAAATYRTDHQRTSACQGPLYDERWCSSERVGTGNFRSADSRWRSQGRTGCRSRLRQDRR